MFTIKPTTRFQKDVKRAQKRGYDMALLTDIIKKLASGEALSAKNRDHALTGNYEIEEQQLFLYLTRTGTHSDLF